MKKEQSCPHELLESIEYSLMELSVLLDRMAPADAKFAMKESLEVLKETDKRLKVLTDRHVMKK